MGVIDKKWDYERKDEKGKKLGEEIVRIGWKGEENVGRRKINEMLEIKIEKGKIIEEEKKDIGVVKNGKGIWWLKVKMKGKEENKG